MTPEQFKNHLAQLKLNVKTALNRDLPRIIGNKAASLFRQNFQKEAFFDDKWEEVNRRKTKTVSYKTKKGLRKSKIVKIGKGAAGSRKILTGSTGDLGRSLKIKTETGAAIIYSDLKYARAHNDGTATAGRSRNTKIQQRRFIGHSPELEKVVLATIEETMNKIIKP
jgi:phage gpG-like protein